jgi:hypothetical protein
MVVDVRHEYPAGAIGRQADGFIETGIAAIYKPRLTIAGNDTNIPGLQTCGKTKHQQYSQAMNTGIQDAEKVVSVSHS